jgi:hypothetical protein
MKTHKVTKAEVVALKPGHYGIDSNSMMATLILRR